MRLFTLTTLKQFLQAAWAPILVLVLHEVAQQVGLRKPLNHPIHFLGGLAAAFFFYRMIPVLEGFIGPVSAVVRYFMAFTAACTMAVFWELGEYASDVFLHTRIQKDVFELLLDLVYGVSGAVLAMLLLLAADAFSRLRGKRPATR